MMKAPADIRRAWPRDVRRQPLRQQIGRERNEPEPDVERRLARQHRHRAEQQEHRVEPTRKRHTMPQSTCRTPQRRAPAVGGHLDGAEQHHGRRHVHEQQQHAEQDQPARHAEDARDEGCDEDRGPRRWQAQPAPASIGLPASKRLGALADGWREADTTCAPLVEMHGGDLATRPPPRPLSMLRISWRTRRRLSAISSTCDADLDHVAGEQLLLVGDVLLHARHAIALAAQVGRREADLAEEHPVRLVELGAVGAMFMWPMWSQWLA